MKMRRCAPFLFAAFAGFPLQMDAASITWIGGTGTWSDGSANNASWSPADEPDPDDAAVFNTAEVIQMGSGNSINGLTMSGGADLLLAGNGLTVAGPATLGGGGTRLELPGATSILQGQNLTINSGGNVFLDGGGINLEIASTPNANLVIAAGGTLSGNGTISMDDGAIATLINNSGTITASNPPQNVLFTPAAATLLFQAANSQTRIDLDGTSETGKVNITRNQTLSLDLTISEAFNSTIEMVHGSTLDYRFALVLEAGSAVNIDNGATTTGFPVIPASTSVIRGNTFVQADGTIMVEDNDGTLQLDVQTVLMGGNFINNGHVIFNRNAELRSGGNFGNVGPTSGITVGGASNVIIEQPNFDLDSLATANSFITVQGNSGINATLGDYDPDSTVNSFSSIINLNNGNFNITTGDAEFVMDGTLNMLSSLSTKVTLWSGEPVDIGNDAGSLDADLNVTGTRVSRFSAQVDFNSDADVDVAAGATLDFTNTVNFDTVNGSNNAEFTGAGTLSFSGVVNVNEAVTLSMAGGTVDLDGSDAAGEFVNLEAPLVINAAVMSGFGRTNADGGVNTLDINHGAGAGVLTVNLGGLAEWSLNAQGVMNLLNDNAEATLLAGSPLNIIGTADVTGDVRADARLDISGAVSINTSGQPLRLSGGGLLTNTNRLIGGTISGVGLLGADAESALTGFGTINTGIDFDGNSNLTADDGTLTIGGTLLDVNTLSATSDGILHFTNAWNSSGATLVQLAGGRITGGAATISNPQGLEGSGTVAARVINNTRIQASSSTTPLVIQTSANDNDWDGSANNGTLAASGGGLLSLHDNAAFTFDGNVNATGGSRIHTVGFGFDFSSLSSITLAGSTYQSDSSADFRGALLVNAGSDSTINVNDNSFLSFGTGSATTLNGNLRLENNNITFLAGATFSGSGALFLPASAITVLGPNANTNVLVINDGTIRVGGFDQIGRVDVRDYQQSETARLLIEMRGINLNEFDRMVVNGAAKVGGTLNLDMDGTYVPVAGQSFIVLSASGGVTGQFSQLELSGVPAGVTFKITYQANSVTATVVAGSQYDLWLELFPSLTNPDDRLKFADPDRDGLANIAEFALGGDPTNPNGASHVFHKIANVSGVPAFTLTVPVRSGGRIAGFNPMLLRDPEDIYRCFVEASDDLVTFNLEATRVPFADESAILATLPPAPAGYFYMTFRSPGPVAGDPREFMRLRITE